ncbi:MAG: RluA family pseudouridine synthase [Candidatus Omnitrophota bacterium]|nr:RluA family pseudouridine synthase [Candidatus Omnitrophota bacterium]
MEEEFIATSTDEGIRLDKFLQQHISSLSRTKISRLINEKKVKVGTQTKKPSYLLKTHDRIVIRFPEEQKSTLLPYALKITVIYEDDDILVIDKPAGISVHPPREGLHNTLVNALIYMGKTLSRVSLDRPGIVHRLDKETSGAMVIAKNNASHYALIEQFRVRRIKKEYAAICWGKFTKDQLTLDVPIARDTKNRLKMKVSFVAAKNAQTEFHIAKALEEATLLRIHLHTGRMHQIRVHLKFLEHPIVGDTKYGIRDGYANLFLHAHRLGLYHPVTGEFLEFTSSLPQWFGDFIKTHTV